MKRLNSYLTESKVTAYIFENALEIDETKTLQDVYEELFDKMFDENMQLNEGLFSWLGSKAKKAGDALDSAGKNADEKINSLSSEAKTAIENVKKKAGNAWEKASKPYTNLVNSIDSAVQKAKKSYDGILTQVGIKMAEFLTVSSQVYANAIENVKGFDEELNKIKENKQQFAALNTLIAGAMMCRKTNINSSTIITLLNSAGIQ